MTSPLLITPIALVDAPTIEVSALISNNYALTLGGDRKLANPKHLKPGMTLRFVLDQDAAGGRKLTFDTLYSFPDGQVPELTATPNAKDMLVCVYDGNVLQCELLKDFR